MKIERRGNFWTFGHKVGQELRTVAMLMGHLGSWSQGTSIHAGTSGGSICTLGAGGLFAGLGLLGSWALGTRTP